jgi:glucose-1-phosphate thymidylyltransferase
VVKGVILHGGAGTRLRPLTFSGPKQLIPVANKPVSQYVLEDIVSSGIRDIAIILGETFPELVREHYGDGSRFNCNITYIYQGKPLGIAHAIGLTEDFVGDDKFVVYLGDNLLQHGIKKYVEYFMDSDLDAMILLKEVDDPRVFGVAEFDEKGNLVRLVEKPKEPPSNYAVIGVYFFTPVVFDIIRRLKPSWRGEYEVTDTIQMLMDEGYKVGYEIVKGWWFDTGKASDILLVNSIILDERIKRDVEGRCVGSRIEGRVSIGHNSEIINSIVRGPVIIGRNCRIESSYIGPYTSIGDDVKIRDSSLEYCIVLDGAYIHGIDRLEESLVGRNAKIYRRSDTRRLLKVNIGDYSTIEL